MTQETAISISPGVLSDISSLATGVNRADVALAALRETPLTPAQITALQELARKYEGDEELHGRASAQLRAENRIQDDPKILAKVGFKGEIPEIPADLIEECSRTGGTLVLKFKTTVTDYQSALNSALGGNKSHLHLYVDNGAKKLAITNDEPTWINVPNTVREDTLGRSKANALKHIPGSELCDPMDTVLMLGYNNLATEEQMPGFKNRWTFTDRKNTLVGSYDDGIVVLVLDRYDGGGNDAVGLAPGFAPESKK